MARIRSVHPGLFTDESFMSASPLARIVMIGVWTEADDNGVFEWKPLTLKARLLPADNADMAAILDELAALNFIREFDDEGKRFGAIRNFRKYQRPKKPNSVHPFPQKVAAYVGLSDGSSEPVPRSDPTRGGKPPQMEDGGGRREEGLSVPSSDETESSRREIARPVSKACFDEFLGTFPKDANASVPKAKQAWNRLPERDRRRLIESVPGYLAYLAAKPGRLACHAATYISERRFEGHLATAQAKSGTDRIYPDTPEWTAWLDHKSRLGEQTAFMEAQGRAGNGFSVPSRFPPKSEAAA